MHNRAILNKEKKRGDEVLKLVRDEDRLFFSNENEKCEIKYVA